MQSLGFLFRRENGKANIQQFERLQLAEMLHRFIASRSRGFLQL
jgi:hypothetical protein